MPINLTFSDLDLPAAPASGRMSSEALPAGRVPSPPRPPAGATIAPPLATMPKGGISAHTRARLLAYQVLATNGGDWSDLADTGQRVNAMTVVNGALALALCAIVVGAMYYARGLL